MYKYKHEIGNKIYIKSLNKYAKVFKSFKGSCNTCVFKNNCLCNKVDCFNNIYYKEIN